MQARFEAFFASSGKQAGSLRLASQATTTWRPEIVKSLRETWSADQRSALRYASLITEGLNRVEPGGFPGRIKAEYNSHANGNGNGGDDSRD